MFARISTLGLMATLALSLPTDRPATYELRSSGAVQLRAAGTEAQFGLAREQVNGKPSLTISLGANGDGGWLGLYTDGRDLPRSGRYPIDFSRESDTGGRWFHACFVAGKPDHPLGLFHGQSGWVDITNTDDGLLRGEFEIRAQGFLASDANDEHQWVTVRGTFTAKGDSTITRIDTVSGAR